MITKSFCKRFKTKCAPEFIDITEWVAQCVAESQIVNGFAVVYSKHTTAAIKINENEPLLLEDMAEFLEKISPRENGYQHNNFEIRTVNMNENEPAQCLSYRMRPGHPPAGRWCQAQTWGLRVSGPERSFAVIRRLPGP